MAINISTRKDNLSNDGDKYFFTSTNTPMSKDEFIDYITKHTNLKARADASRALLALEEATVCALKSGYRVPLILGDLYIAAKGTCSTEDAPFTPTFTTSHDHHFELRFSHDPKDYRDLYTDIQYQRIRYHKNSIHDPKVKSITFINETTMLIEGNALRHDILDKDCGLFLINEGGRYRQRSSNVGKKDFFATLDQSTPDGLYRIQFVTKRSKGSELLIHTSDYMLKVGDGTIIQYYYDKINEQNQSK